ncbi:Bifunctional adenosylcobalamin biosynthesis protein CobP [Thalassocella blandensis]|nr:Bifunctional adenosylcobalamin biosynthesis protein CobP [Thalassocella blandensis]
MKHLVLGGARSGKSRYAEQQANALFQQRTEREGNGVSLHYVATATANDEEMQQRIVHHQRARHAQWQLSESPEKLAETLLCIAEENPSSIVVVDCLTLWLSNILHANTATGEIDALLQVLPQCNSDIILVSNEVGSGIVPLGKLSRDFVDTAGRLHQALVPLCDAVTLVIAGLPLPLKQQDPA